MLVSIYFLYLYEITDFYSTNETLKILQNFFVNVNFFLINNLNKFHPFIFYCSIFLFFYIVLYLFYIFFFNFNIFSDEFFFFKSWYIFIFFLNLSALYLGSWWALQEGTWGGWWNWDPSEVFGLLISLTAVYAIHIKHHPINFIALYTYFNLFLFFFILVYCLIQLNFDLISHNFGIKFFYFFNNTLYLCEFFVFSLFCSLIIFTYYVFFWINFLLFFKKLFFSKPNKFFIKVFLLFLLTFFLCHSFNSMFNYFLLNFFSFNFSNSSDIWLPSRLTVYFILIFLWRIFYNFNVLNVIWFFWIFNSYHFVLIFLMLISIFFSIVFFTHWFFLQFLFINVFTSWTQLSICFFKTPYFVSLLQNIFSSNTINYFNLDAFSSELHVFYYLYSNFWKSNFYFLFLPFYLITSKFLLIYFNSLLINILLIENFFSYFITIIEIPFIENLNIWMLFLTITLFFVYLLKKWLIFK